MFTKIAEQVRYRRALKAAGAPSEPDPAYFSRFGGLWTDRRDAPQEIDRRLERGTIDAADADRLRHWFEAGYVVLEGAVDPAVCDGLRADLETAFEQGDERLLCAGPEIEGYRPLSSGFDTERLRVVDVHAFYESARAALFAEPIERFLRTIFDDDPMLFQSLTFEKGSQQDMHQDTLFVVTTSPLEFAASWVALEDIEEGSGELMYVAGSHRAPEYLFSGRYKHWDQNRDGDAEEDAWRRQLEENIDRHGYERRTFLPRKGDVLLWSADLAHGGSPVKDPSLTRKSIVGHYCPARVPPFYFATKPDRRGRGRHDDALFASYHYAVGP